MNLLAVDCKMTLQCFDYYRPHGQGNVFKGVDTYLTAMLSCLFEELFATDLQDIFIMFA